MFFIRTEKGCEYFSSQEEAYRWAVKNFAPMQKLLIGEGKLSSIESVIFEMQERFPIYEVINQNPNVWN